MSKIKKFFSKKKEEAAAFKVKLMGNSMGEGHKLNTPKQEAPSSSSNSRGRKYEAYVPPKRNELSNEARAAAAAALARIDKKTSREFNTSLSAVKAQAKRELEAERRQKEEASATAEVSASTTSTSSGGDNRNLACEGVFFRCPMVSDEILPKKDWKVKIKEFLYQQLEEGDRGLTACLIIHNCNVKEKADDCIATLVRYLENLITNPTDEKFLKIRMSNKIFSEKVRYVEGALDVLYAAGFSEVQIDDEPFLLWTREQTEQDLDLPTLVDALKNSECIPLELDRNLKVLLPSQARRVVLPNDFYRLAPEEIKKEQQLRTEAIQQAQMLRTKAMREREEQRTLRMYRYALIRVKFPNGLFIQGTFNVYEKISDIFEFVQSCLADETLEFNLVATSEGKFGEEDMDKTLFDCKIIPNSLLLFCTEASSSDGSTGDVNYLKEELFMLVQAM
ncbi:UBX domain-containing protein 6 [Drosophila guanche]|uniref:UBX domain-containing protein 6 n=1 Tax=Drosophila guanche TaxID=7266 RepID=A0A3B0J2V7_DROGU|nr:UBX domain-containing protein 6 [Drosophila guanche]SPP73493.1 blast:UBX domain-containing protein 6 [Drosophila guanche]